MPSQSRKHRGYASQRIVAERFRVAGWPYAEPTGAGRQGTDVLGVVGLDIEVKARRGLDLPGWMRQAAERAGDRTPLLIVRPDGFGEASIDAWPAIMPLGVMLETLKDAGYQ
jgi:hypothetical protein